MSESMIIFERFLKKIYDGILVILVDFRVIFRNVTGPNRSGSETLVLSRSLFWQVHSWELRREPAGLSGNYGSPGDLQGSPGTLETSGMLILIVLLWRKCPLCRGTGNNRPIIIIIIIFSLLALSFSIVCEVNKNFTLSSYSFRFYLWRNNYWFFIRAKTYFHSMRTNSSVLTLFRL